MKRSGSVVVVVVAPPVAAVEAAVAVFYSQLPLATGHTKSPAICT
tara:strand:+ start:161 stop:295 length:135 start_codon:yes stop_codon:yes gene_type:complete